MSLPLKKVKNNHSGEMDVAVFIQCDLSNPMYMMKASIKDFIGVVITKQ